MLKSKRDTIRCLDEIIREYESISNNNEEQDGTSEFFSAYGMLNNREVENCSKSSYSNIEDRLIILNELKEYIDSQESKNLQKTSLEKSEKVRYSMLDVLELDRKRIARDLHDSSVQILTMLVHKAELCEKLIEIDQNRAKMELNYMGGILKDAIAELRHTIYNLRPMTMDDLGLMDSIERYIQMLLQSSEINFKVSVNNIDNLDIEQLLNPVEKLSIFRVLQECCSNIVKHSRAKNALISLGVDSEYIEIIVKDDGVGFQHQKTLGLIEESKMPSFNGKSNYSGFGLSMLHERIYLLNGITDIESSSKGTVIKIRIPIVTNEEDIDETY